jgi:hypothetical protein
LTIPRWNPREELTKREQLLQKRGKVVKKLFAFLREQRRVIFSDTFQDELATMYRDTGEGVAPIAPAIMAMAVLLQAYVQSSDAETVELTILDLRWQMVLDCLGSEEPLFSQGAFFDFRQRLIKFDMDRRLLERTIEVAKESKGFDWKKLPKDLRVGMDSRPLVGNGKVEDTFNLLGHAARKIAETAAALLGIGLEEVCRLGQCPVLLASSVKAGLDLNWSDPVQKAEAMNDLCITIDSLSAWVAQKLPQAVTEQPLLPYIEKLAQVKAQDLEVVNGKTAIRQGVAPDRLISIEDPEMRHGRKSKSKKFNGYKEHQASWQGTGLILAAAVVAANQPDEEGGILLFADVERIGHIVRLDIDRAYINGPYVDKVETGGGEVLCKPWPIRNSKKLFTKANFKLDLELMTITCPQGEVEPIELGETVRFDEDACGPCPLREKCTHSANGKGRTVNIAKDELRQKRLRHLQNTKVGRARLRERTEVEHTQAHTARRKGSRARYIGARKNQFDLRRTAATQNLERIQLMESRLPPTGSCAPISTRSVL